MFYHAEIGLSDGLDACEVQRIAAKSCNAVTEEPEPVDRRWHSHRYDDTRGFSGEHVYRSPVCPVFERDTGPKHLLYPRLEQRGHGSEPEREHENKVIRRTQLVGGVSELIGNFSIFELPFASE